MARKGSKVYTQESTEATSPLENIKHSVKITGKKTTQAPGYRSKPLACYTAGVSLEGEPKELREQTINTQAGVPVSCCFPVYGAERHPTVHQDHPI